jgi:hypothetical protein
VCCRALTFSEVSEDWITPLDASMEGIGGEVIRKWRLIQIKSAIDHR